MNRFLLILVSCLCLTTVVSAQSNKLIKELESKRGALQQQIAETESLLKNTKKDVGSQLNGLFNVLIRHGDYISVYCNLSSASVKSGDTVTTKQAIGPIFSDGSDNGRTVLHFQLRRERDKLNPEPWLNR